MLLEQLSPRSPAFVKTAEQIAREVVESLAEAWDRENRPLAKQGDEIVDAQTPPH